MTDIINSEEYKELKDYVISRRNLLHDESEIIERFIENVKVTCDSINHSMDLLSGKTDMYSQKLDNVNDKLSNLENSIDILNSTINLFSKYISEKIIESIEKENLND